MALAALPDELLQHPHLFRGGQRLDTRRDGVPSGLAELDAVLPWGGFPRGALSELLLAHDGIGELRLLLPALHRLCAEAPVALVQPPYIPYAPALAQAGLPLERLIWVAAAPERSLWAAEQCLRAGCLSAVLLWDAGGDTRPLRRLQVAADNGRSLAFLFRPERHRGNPSPAALRLHLTPGELELVKCRGMAVQGQPTGIENRESGIGKKPRQVGPTQTQKTNQEQIPRSVAALAPFADKPALACSRVASPPQPTGLHAGGRSQARSCAARNPCSPRFPAVRVPTPST